MEEKVIKEFEALRYLRDEYQKISKYGEEYSLIMRDIKYPEGRKDVCALTAELTLSQHVVTRPWDSIYFLWRKDDQICGEQIIESRSEIRANQDHLELTSILDQERIIALIMKGIEYRDGKVTRLFTNIKKEMLDEVRKGLRLR